MSLPFFFDDLEHIPFAIKTPYLDIFGGPGGFPYFRPIGVASHRLIAQLFGERNAFAQHAANLLVHSINGCLVGLLVIRSSAKNRTWQPYLATIFFVVFPFSYQAVPWIDARYHLLVLTLLLVAVLAAQRFVYSGNWRWLLVTAAACFLAPLTHENGNAAAVLPIIYLILQANRRWALILRIGLTTLSSSAAGFWLWQRAAPPTGDLQINQLETLFQNSAYFLQGLGWLIAWPGGWLMRQGINDLTLAIASGILAIAVAVWVGGRMRGSSSVLFALCWCGAGSVLTIFLLSFTYVIDGPRLLYVSSAGISLLWAGLLQDSFSYYRKLWQRGLIVLITLAGLGSAGVFHLRSYQLYQLAGGGVDAATDAVIEADATMHDVTIVNLVDWFAWPDPFYAVGHEGVVFLPDYIAARRLVDVAVAVDVAPTFARFDDTITDVPLVFGLSGGERAWLSAEKPHDVYLMTYSAESFTSTAQLVGVAGLNRELQDGAIRFEGDGVIWLDSAETRYEHDALVVSLTWHVEEGTEQPISVFVHGLAADGILMDQSDGRPFNQMFPFETWIDGSTGQDVRYLDDAIHELRIGLYNANTGERWQASGESVIVGENAIQFKMLDAE